MKEPKKLKKKTKMRLKQEWNIKQFGKSVYFKPMGAVGDENPCPILFDMKKAGKLHV